MKSSNTTKFCYRDSITIRFFRQFNKYNIIKITIFIIFLLLINTQTSSLYANNITIKRNNGELSEKSKLSDKDNTLADLRELIKDMRYQLLCAQQEIASLQILNHNLKDSLSKSEANSDLISKQNTSMQKEIISKQSQVDQLSSLINQNKQEIKDIENNQIAEFNSKILDLSSKLEESKKSYSLLEQKSLQDKENSQTSIQNIRNDKNREISDLQQKLDFYEKKTETLSNNLIILNSELNLLKHSPPALTGKQSPIQNKDYEIKLSDSSKIQNLENVVSIYQNKVKNLYSELEKVNNELITTKSKLISTQNNDQQDTNKEKEVYIRAMEYLKNDNPSSAILYYNLAKAYQDIKDYPHSIENYKLALNYNPKLIIVYRDMGMAFAEQKDYENSSINFKKYLEYTDNPEEKRVIQQFLSKL